MPTYRLSERERELIACLELDADASIQTVAKRLRLRPHTVQYLLTKLQNNQVIKKSAFIDIHRLGLRYCGIFISVRGNLKQKRSLVSYLSTSNQVGWFAELGGAYSYGIALAVKGAKDANEFLLELIRNTHVKIYKKAISFRLQLIDTPRHYLTNRSVNREPLSVIDGVDLVRIDDLDEHILDIISSSPELSYRSMAKLLGIAHTTFDLRVRKLKQSGIIVGTTLDIDLRWLGREAFKILIFARGKDPSLSNELQKYAIDHPLVSHYVECFGQWDYEMNLEVSSLEQISEVSDELQDKFGDRLVDTVPLSVLKVHSVKRYPFTRKRLVTS